MSLALLAAMLPAVSTHAEGRSDYARYQQQLGFQPLDRQNTPDVRSSTAPGLLPQGFTATKLISAGDPTASGQPLPGEGDMITLDPGERYLFTVHETKTNAALTRLDLQTGVAEVIAQNPAWSRMDPVKWTPWGTLVIGEEYAGGRIYEVHPWTGEYWSRDSLGTFAHEGIAFGPDGSVYLGDENGDGAIYKFVPASYGNLREGTLYALKDGEGWIRIENPAMAAAEAKAKGATLFNRPEDMEVGPDGNVYVTVTATHQVLRFAPGDRPQVQVFVQGGPVGQNDFNWPDNLAFDTKGNLYIAEDIPDNEKLQYQQQDDIWVALPDRDGDGKSDGIFRFASLSTSQGAAYGAQNEPTGIYFNRDGSRLYLNQQHADNPLWVITGFDRENQGERMKSVR